MDKAKLEELNEKVDMLHKEISEALRGAIYKSHESTLPECFNTAWYHGVHNTTTVYALIRGIEFEIAECGSEAVCNAICALPDLIKAALKVVRSPVLVNERNLDIVVKSGFMAHLKCLKESLAKAGIQVE